MVRLGFALGAQQFGESLRVLQVAEDFGLSADYDEIAGGQGGEVGDFGRRVEREIGAERRLRLVGREVIERDLEGEAAQGGGVEIVAKSTGSMSARIRTGSNLSGGS